MRSSLSVLVMSSLKLHQNQTGGLVKRSSIPFRLRNSWLKCDVCLQLSLNLVAALGMRGIVFLIG